MNPKTRDKVVKENYNNINLKRQCTSIQLSIHRHLFLAERVYLKIKTNKDQKIAEHFCQPGLVNQ